MTKMTHHASVDRFERIEYIIDHVGFGNPVASCISTRNKQPRKMTLTDTGVIIIQNVNTDTVITMYIARMDEAIFIYRNGTHQQRLPEALFRRIRNNAVHAEASNKFYN